MDKSSKNLCQKQKVVEEGIEIIEKRARKCKEARKEFHEEIRKAKREMWVQLVEEGKSVWDIAMVARNPFNLKTRCTKVDDEEGQLHSENSDIAAAFIKHKLITEATEQEAEEDETREQVRRGAPGNTAMRRVQKALSKIKNHSAAGISWRLLKMIKETALGQAVLKDAALGQLPRKELSVRR